MYILTSRRVKVYSRRALNDEVPPGLFLKDRQTAITAIVVAAEAEAVMLKAAMHVSVAVEEEEGVVVVVLANVMLVVAFA
jgi:hypothetical protein